MFKVFFNTDRSMSTASATQVRKPFYSGSVDHWKKYEKQLAPSIKALKWIRRGNNLNGVQLNIAVMARIKCSVGSATLSLSHYRLSRRLWTMLQRNRRNLSRWWWPPDAGMYRQPDRFQLADVSVRERPNRKVKRDTGNKSPTGIRPSLPSPRNSGPVMLKLLG